MNEASKLASDAGNATAQNVVLLGALASTGKLPIRKISLTEVLAELFAAKHAKTNVEASNSATNI